MRVGPQPTGLCTYALIVMFTFPTQTKVPPLGKLQQLPSLLHSFTYTKMF